VSLPGRALGIDFGRRRIGLAVTDALGIAATPVEVVDARDRERAVDRIAEVARDREAAVLVIGMPWNMDGTEHVMSRDVQAFARACAKRTGLPVEFEDERLTSVEAERQLAPARTPFRKRKGRLDQVAAVLILRQWLERRAAEDAGPREADAEA